MSRLYLHCGLCGRRQAEGLLSRAAWGQLEHRLAGVIRACPTCRGKHPDWEARLRAGADGVEVGTPSGDMEREQLGP